MTNDEFDREAREPRPELTPAQLDAIKSLLGFAETLESSLAIEMALRGVLAVCAGADCPLDGMEIGFRDDPDTGTRFWTFTEPSDPDPEVVSCPATYSAEQTFVKPGLAAAAFCRGAIHGAVKGIVSPEVAINAKEAGRGEVLDEGEVIFHTYSPIAPEIVAQAFADGAFANV